METMETTYNIKNLKCKPKTVIVFYEQLFSMYFDTKFDWIIVSRMDKTVI